MLTRQARRRFLTLSHDKFIEEISLLLDEGIRLPVHPDEARSRRNHLRLVTRAGIDPHKAANPPSLDIAAAEAVPLILARITRLVNNQKAVPKDLLKLFERCVNTLDPLLEAKTKHLFRLIINLHRGRSS